MNNDAHLIYEAFESNRSAISEDTPIGMALNELITLIDQASTLKDILQTKPSADLMPWESAKITLAADYIDSVTNVIKAENKLTENTQAGVYEDLAKTRSRLYLTLHALKECLKHFSSEPTDPGHPALLRLVKKTLDEID